MKPNDLISELLTYSKPTPQQQLIIALQAIQRTPSEQRKLAALVRAELAERKAADARHAVSAMLKKEKTADAIAKRQARTHAMIESAGLMGLAGLLDVESGEPRLVRDELLGALVAIVESVNPENRMRWQRAGAKIFAEAIAKKKAAMLAADGSLLG